MTTDDIRLILRLARGDAAGVARCLAAREASPPRLVENALAGGLAVVLLRALVHLPDGVELPASYVDALRARQRRQETRAAMLLEALARVGERFAAAGQAFLLLKGPYLAERVYGDIVGREFVDLDLLVPAGNRQRASRLLDAEGFRRRSGMIVGEAVTSVFVHAFDFAAGDASIDLHWRLSRHPSLRIDEARIWAARQSWALSGRPYGVLSDEHELVFGALSLLRDIERGRPKAKNVIDIVQIAAAADSTLEWDGVMERARGEGTFGPLVNVLSLCLDVADAHDLAPRLGASLERHAARRVPGRPSGEPCRFRPLGGGLGNKWWSARAHDTSPAAWLLWWAASLPFRVAVHGRPVRRQPESGIEARP
jgi:hypothetical protein